tara:strand:- start:658 stop:1350 length:693 start_codon:yes stop_codon:yes gene_type:complete
MRNFLLLLMLNLPFFVHAEPVSSEFELGLLSTSGNSEGKTINSQLILIKETTAWVYKGSVAALFDSSNKMTSAEKYNLDLQADKKLPAKQTFYLLFASENDRFSGFDHQTSIGVGYGWQLIATDVHTLGFEIGPGYRVNALAEQPDEKELTLRVGESYQWQLSKTATLSQYLKLEGGGDNTISRLGVNLKSQLLGNLSLSIGIDGKYTEHVPLGRDHADTETYARIAYQF